MEHKTKYYDISIEYDFDGHEYTYEYTYETSMSMDFFKRGLAKIYGIDTKNNNNMILLEIFIQFFEEEGMEYDLFEYFKEDIKIMHQDDAYKEFRS